MARKQTPISKYLAKIGQRGGQAKVPKGFAAISEERRQEIAAKSLATRRKNAAAKKRGRK